MIRRHWPAFADRRGRLRGRPEPVRPSRRPSRPPRRRPRLRRTHRPAADVSVKELVARQAAVERQYKAFTTNLLALAQKLEKSDRIEDKDKAKALRKAIDLADKEGVDNKFTTLLRTLTQGPATRPSRTSTRPRTRTTT